MAHNEQWTCMVSTSFSPLPSLQFLSGGRASSVCFSSLFLLLHHAWPCVTTMIFDVWCRLSFEGVKQTCCMLYFCSLCPKLFCSLLFLVEIFVFVYTKAWGYLLYSIMINLLLLLSPAFSWTDGFTWVIILSIACLNYISWCFMH